MDYYILDFRILDVIEHYITKNITVTKMLRKLHNYTLHIFDIICNIGKFFSILSFLFF